MKTGAEKYAHELGTNWNRPHVARAETERFTSGVLKPRTIANMESLGDPVPGRFLVGRKVVYPTATFAQYIAERFFKNA